MKKVLETVSELTVESYTDVIGPSVAMLGTLADGGTLVAHTTNGCWGPMLTPELKSGHEVCQPVAIAGANVGDAVAITIERITIRSRAASSGTDAGVAGRFVGDPFVAPICPGCGVNNPASIVKGIGAKAIRCKACGAEIAPFEPTSGYTMVFDRGRSVGVTVGKEKAEEIARHRSAYSGLWPATRQNSVLCLALSELPGTMSRVRPMIGNIGTSPAVTMPSSHNAGDFGQFLVGAPHGLAISQEDLTKRTDAHMDVDSVGVGSVLICPVKIPGAGVYVADVHAMMGDGEIAGHTTDVSAEVVLKVTVLKGLAIDGPILLPRLEDLPPLAKPYTASELRKGASLAKSLGVELQTQVAPVQVVGSGADLNAAVNNGVERLAKLAGESVDQTRNRITITGGIEIGRLPGVVQVTALLPLARLDKLGLSDLYRQRYGLGK